MKLFDLTGKYALVTGGTRGLGKGIAEGLAEAGATVVIVGSNDSVVNVAKEMNVKGLKCDLSDRKALASLMDSALDMMNGRIDILVAAAGIQRRHPSTDFPMEDWDDVINVNLNSVFTLNQLAGRKMIAQGGGKIINVASLLSFFGGITVPAYAASKGGIAQLTKALANEWSGKNVQVNAIAPGYMATDMNEALINDQGRNKEIIARIPAGRWGTGNDMKGAAIFLASEASQYESGVVIPVDGGYLGR